MAEYKEIVRKRAGRAVPVISMGGSNNQEAMYEGFNIYAFLEKPIARRLLFDLVRSVN